MSIIARITLFTIAAAALLFSGCSLKTDPAVAFTKEFIKKAATGDKTLKDMIDFEIAANRYGTTEQEYIKKEGQQKWEKTKDDMVATIQSSFAPLKESYGSAFKKFRIEERGADYWIVSYLNPAKQRVQMMVKKRNGALKGYFYQR